MKMGKYYLYDRTSGRSRMFRAGTWRITMFIIYYSVYLRSVLVRSGVSRYFNFRSS